jgi:hypothetical protein
MEKFKDVTAGICNEQDSLKHRKFLSGRRRATVIIDRLDDRSKRNSGRSAGMHGR